MNNNTNEKRLLKFTAHPTEERYYELYVKEGKIIYIMCFTPCECEVIHPEDDMFDLSFEITLTTLSQYKNLVHLKKLYNALEDGRWKEDVNKRINNLIDYFEKGLAILKFKS